MQRIYIFKRFERFWHWAQALLVIFMLASGFEIHGLYKLFGFKHAVQYHTIAAWSLIGLWVFAIFWHFTTGEWKHYVPTLDKLDAVIKYYLTGIFRDAPHPFRVTRLQKHNPLQRLAYLKVKLLINPLIWITGALLLFYADWPAWGIGRLQLGTVAVLHTIGAFLMLIFLIVHVYFVTTGHTPLAQIKAMITGWDEVEDEQPAAAK
jgi:thiosulfate reductase cytochrome b subunit